MNRLVFIKAETTKDGTRIYLLPLSTIKQINFTDSEAELSVWDREMKEIKTTVGVTNDGTYISLGLDALRSIGDGIFALSLNLKLEGESQDYPDKEYFYIKLKHDDQHVILENVWTREKPYKMFQDSTDNGNRKGKDGKSAYDIWLANGHTGTEIDFLNWLQGPKGDPGVAGKDGHSVWYSTKHYGPNQAECWFADLANASASNPPKVNDIIINADGNMAMITKVNIINDSNIGGGMFDYGPWVGNIKGPKGDPGHTPVKGVDYWTDEDKKEMQDMFDKAIENGKW